MDLVQIGKFIAQLRKEHELSQEKLGEILGVTNKTISRWETGTNLPDIDLLVQLSDFYGVDVRELIDGERKSEQKNQESPDSIKKVAEYSSLKEKILIKQYIILMK